MGSKTTDWRPGPTVCRCCLSEGCYKDISTEYFWMGKREVYAEMLSETFSLSIAYSQSGGPNSNSRLICEPCISRLRDASDFRKQVQECEKTFMQYLDPGTSVAELEVTVEPVDTQVKVERVKLEKAVSDDDFDDRTDFREDDDDDDDLDDQPLTKLASKVPKKESVDILDLLDNAKVGEKRKSSSKAKTPVTKKSKTKKEAKATSSKAPKPEKKKKECSPMSKVRRNAQSIVRYLTAYPFKLPNRFMTCVYCGDAVDEPSEFRRHMTELHDEVKIRVAFAHIPEGYIKVDCTDLRCRICNVFFERIETAAEHLIKVHNQNIDLTCDLGVQPFIFHKEKKWSCALCDAIFISLRALSRHTQSHFIKYTCESCGKSYFSSSSLRFHMRVSHIGEQRICVKCKMTFKTLEAKRKHVQDSPRCWVFICSVCGQRFVSSTLMNAHKTEVHGVQSKSYACPECPEVFPNRHKYRFHFITTHTNEYFECNCGLKFDTKNNLKKHMVVHTKEKLFPCTVCSKAFARKKNLVQHMWIHSENKRFECVDCKKQFNQKVTWKTHMKSHHPDVVIT